METKGLCRDVCHHDMFKQIIRHLNNYVMFIEV